MIDITTAIAVSSITANAMLAAKCWKLFKVAHECPLTKLRNKYSFDSRKGYQKERFVFIDICFLKLHNDNKNHEAGNEYLAAIGTFLKGLIREKDVYRLSGDEFLVTVQGSDNDALRVIDRLKAAISASKEHGILAKYHDSAHPVELAMGIGVTVKAADLAMYKDKTVIHKNYGYER
jgi:diguanylate cyclase (GGDEF)-like protein